MITNFTVCLCVCECLSEGASHTRAASGSLRNTGTVMWGPLQPYNCTTPLLFIWFISLHSSFPAMTLWIPTKREKYGVGEWIFNALLLFFTHCFTLERRVGVWGAFSRTFTWTHSTRFWYLYEKLSVIIHELLRCFNTSTGYRFVDIFCERCLDGCLIALSGHKQHICFTVVCLEVHSRVNVVPAGLTGQYNYNKYSNRAARVPVITVINSISLPVTLICAHELRLTHP